MVLNLNNRYILLLDVETANDTTDALVYDVSGMLIDCYGNVYEQFAFVIRDIFCDERELMKVAYYGNKIPEYVQDIQQGKRQMVDFLQAWNYIKRLMKCYGCKTVAAYNCNFDRNALNTTLRFLTKSKYRWFFPHDTKFICIWNMACNSICQSGEYRTFAETNRYFSNHGKNYRATAETVYAFLTNNPQFNEEHKGYEDVKIEKEILTECIKNGVDLMGISRACWQKVKRGALVLRVKFLLIFRAGPRFYILLT